MLRKIPFFLGMALFLTGCSISHVMRVEDRQVIDVDTMVEEVKDAPVILVGERHDAPSHHRLQLDILKKLKSKEKTLAIGMEMFEDSSQKALDAWSAGKVPESAFRRVYEWNWRNIPWNLYEEILLWARDNRVPIVGLNAPRGVVQKVARSGLRSLGAEELAQLPQGIDLQVDDLYCSFLASAYPVHGGSGEAFRNICEAQALRNRVMARHIIDYLAQHREATMVVVAGGGHAREEGGIPAELGNLRRRVILPTVEGLEKENVSRKDGDYLMEERSYWLELLF